MQNKSLPSQIFNSSSMANHTCVKALVYRRDNVAIHKRNYVNKVRIRISNPGASTLVVMTNFKG